MVLKKIDNFSPRKKAPNGGISKILYVEDEDMNWNVTELHLRGKYELLRARTSQETFRLLAEQSFDLVLLDIQLAASEFDGIEICKILKRRPGQLVPRGASNLQCSDVPIVFVTAYSARYSKDELIRAAGADDVVTKPVDFARLRLVTSRLIAKNIMKSRY